GSDGKNWMGEMYKGMSDYWRHNQFAPQAGIRFTWRRRSGETPAFGFADPNFLGNGHNSIAGTDFDPDTSDASQNLIDLIIALRRNLPADEPINIVAHSQGTMITLAALARTAFKEKSPMIKVNNVLLLNSPISIANGWEDIQKVIANKNTESMRFYWNPRDEVVVLENGRGVGRVNVGIRSFREVKGKLEQIKLDVSQQIDANWYHNGTLGRLDGYNLYARPLALTVNRTAAEQRNIADAIRSVIADANPDRGNFPLSHRGVFGRRQ